MATYKNLKLQAALRSLVRFSYGFIILIGFLELLAWAVNKHWIVNTFPKVIPMNPLTALMFILSGIGLSQLLRKIKEGYFSKFLSIIIILLAVIKLSTIVTGIETHIDTWMLYSKVYKTGMSNIAALNFLLCGIALLFISFKNSKVNVVAQAIAFLGLLISLYAVLGYLYNFSELHTIEVYFPMAMHTALCFGFLSLGILCVKPRKGYMRVVTSSALGSVLSRKLIPFAIFLPVFFDWLRFQGQRNELFPNIDSGISLLSISAILVLSIIIWITAYNLNKIDVRRKHAEKKLIHAKILAESAKKSQEQFLANMSHEIRTPLNGVVGMASLLKTTNLSEEQRGYIETIRLSSESLLTIVNDILDFSKIESGKLELESLPFSIKGTIEQTFDLLQLDAKAKDIELQYFIDPKAPGFIIGDIIRFRQILVNLVSNGIKFTEAGKISVNVEFISKIEDQYELSISVKDTGIGIAKDKLDRLFKAFSQADVSTTRRFGGTGLGLAISSNLVKMMDGHMGVKSEPGRGSDFYFTIKVRTPTASAIFESTSLWKELPDVEPDMLNLNLNLEILVAEDNAINLKIIKKMLEKLGYNSDTVANGKEAITAFDKKFYDIVMMDMQMPVMDGMEATSLLIEKFKDEKKKPVIIALTANALKGEREKCIETGMDDYLSKPFQLTDIQSLIGKWGSGS